MGKVYGENVVIADTSGRLQLPIEVKEKVVPFVEGIRVKSRAIVIS